METKFSSIKFLILVSDTNEFFTVDYGRLVGSNLLYPVSVGFFPTHSWIPVYGLKKISWCVVKTIQFLLLLDHGGKLPSGCFKSVKFT